jgi:hypothetical protein
MKLNRSWKKLKRRRRKQKGDFEGSVAKLDNCGKQIQPSGGGDEKSLLQNVGAVH